MFKENKETPMVVLIVLFIVFSVLSWFRILPGNLAENAECMQQWQPYRLCSASETERLAKL